MNLILSLPWEVRLAALALIGAFLGGQINRGVYRLAWYKRAIGPWSAPDPAAPPRAWHDRLPLFGWWGLRREAKLHGPGYWVRPLLVELLCAAGLPALYFWETTGQLVPALAICAPTPLVAWLLHVQFLSHAILCGLMLVASLIDVDEKTIPDEITVPGVLLALVMAAAIPEVGLPDLVPVAANPTGLLTCELRALVLTSPHPWPGWLDGTWGLAIGLATLAGWCFAILPSRTWWTRSGPGKALQYLLASILREPYSKYYLALLLLGGAAIAGAWAGGNYLPAGAWQSLLSALIGMAFGGALIWAVRVIGSSVLAKEAMGFGDVTLMAMIGAFLGWQASLIVFFLAPLAGVVIAVGQWLVTRRTDIWFGPFLCAAALVLIVDWSRLWGQYCREIFWLGWMIPVMVVVCLVLMGVLLGLWRLIKIKLLGVED